MSQLVTVGSVEHYQVLLHNVQEHSRASFGLTPAGHHTHADLHYVLGFIPQPRPFLPPPADSGFESASCHPSAQQATGPSQHPTPTPEAEPASQPGMGDDGHSRPVSPEFQATSPRYTHRGSEDGSVEGAGEGIGSRPASPGYSPTSPMYSPRGSEDGSVEGPDERTSSGPVSPEYSPTSPTYSPRGSEDGYDGYAVTSPVYRPSSPAGSQDSPAGSPVHRATIPVFAGDPSGRDPQPNPIHPDSQPEPDDVPQAFTTAAPALAQADSARPGTSRGRRPSQQQGHSSGFSFDRRPAAAQTSAAASDPEGGDPDRVELSSGHGTSQHVNQDPAEETVSVMDWTPAHSDASTDSVHPSHFVPPAAAAAAANPQAAAGQTGRSAPAAEADAWLSGLSAEMSAQAGHESPLSSLPSYSDPDDKEVQESAEVTSADPGSKASPVAPNLSAADPNDHPSASDSVWGTPQASGEQVPASSFATQSNTSSFSRGSLHTGAVQGQQPPFGAFTTRHSSGVAQGQQPFFSSGESPNQHFGGFSSGRPPNKHPPFGRFSSGQASGQQPSFGGFTSGQSSPQQPSFGGFTSGQPSGAAQGQQPPFAGFTSGQPSGATQGQQPSFGDFSSGQSSFQQPSFGGFASGHSSTQQPTFGCFSFEKAPDKQPGSSKFTFGQRTSSKSHGSTGSISASFGTNHQPHSFLSAAPQPDNHSPSGAEQSPSAGAGSYGAGSSFGNAPGRERSARFKFSSSGYAKEQNGSAATNGEHPD